MTEPATENLGPRTLRGEVRLTSKGNSPLIDGVFLVLEGSPWAHHADDRHQGLRGRLVEASGILFRRPCRPGEQCVEGGAFVYLAELDDFRFVDAG